MIYDRSEQAELEYDRLDDQGQFTAAEIREMTDYETDGSNEDFTVEAITVRAGGELALKGVGFEFHGNPKDGLNKQAWANQSPTQKAINAEGLNKVRNALGRNEETKG